MTYAAGTKIIRLTKIEEAVPFLKLGKTVIVGKKFPLRSIKLNSKYAKVVKAETNEGNLNSDYFYLVK